MMSLGDLRIDHRKTMGKWENHGKIIGKWWFNGI